MFQSLLNEGLIFFFKLLTKSINAHIGWQPLRKHCEQPVKANDTWRGKQSEIMENTLTSKDRKRWDNATRWQPYNSWCEHNCTPFSLKVGSDYPTVKACRTFVPEPCQPLNANKKGLKGKERRWLKIEVRTGLKDSNLTTWCCWTCGFSGASESGQVRRWRRRNSHWGLVLWQRIRICAWQRNQVGSCDSTGLNTN